MFSGMVEIAGKIEVTELCMRSCMHRSIWVEQLKS
jgi:hypothetical protein